MDTKNDDWSMHSMSNSGEGVMDAGSLPAWSGPLEELNRSVSDLDGPIQTAKRYDFRFSGSGSEYFRIWIVNLASYFYPLITLPFLLLIAFVHPWLVVKSFAFNARYTRHRNLSFGFVGLSICGFW